MTTALIVSYAILWVLVLANTVILIGVVRLVGNDAPSTSKSGPVAGSPIPRFSTTASTGNKVSDDTLRGKTSALLFVSPDCATCSATLEEMAALDYKVDRDLIVICRSSSAKCAQIPDLMDGKYQVVFDSNDELSRSFGITVNPTAVTISEGGRILQFGHPLRGEELQNLLHSV